MSKDFETLVKLAEASFAKLTENNKHWVRVGYGMSGQAAGADLIFEKTKEVIKNRSLDATSTLVGALGLMYLEPTLDITDSGGFRVFYANVKVGEVEQILEEHIQKKTPNIKRAYAYLAPPNLKVPPGIPELSDITAWSMQKRVIMRNFGSIDPNNILHYVANDGYQVLKKALFELTPHDVLERVANSGLRGRGGAAFPTGFKWGFLEKSSQKPKYVLCNCEEGDPGAFNDKGIIESDPHTLLEGLILCGYATRSHKGYVFIRHGHDIPINAMRRAISEAYEHGILGEKIMGTDFTFDVEVALTGDSYVAGEETALMEAIEGKRATPRFKPPFPAVAGLWQKPTNINNVKTLAYVPQIVGNGSDWFKGIGTEKSSGTALVCLSGHIKRPGLYEVEMGTTIRSLIYDIGGGIVDGAELKLLQTGGPLGGVMGVEGIDCRVDFDEMSKAGAILGSGGIIVCDDRVSVIDLTRNLIAFNQFESCGKCFPCRLGNTHMLDVLDRICKNKAREGDLELMERIGSSLKTGSLCGHGQLGYNPISSALRYFEAEFVSQMLGEGAPLGSFEDGSMLAPTRTRP